MNPIQRATALLVLIACFHLTRQVHAQVSFVPASHTMTGGYAYAVTVSGQYAYIANLNDLRIYDVSDPANPTCVGFARVTGESYWAINIAGHHAFLGGRFNGLRVYDVSDPRNPVSAGFANDGAYIHGVAVAGNCAYLSVGGLLIYDISDPTNPIKVGRTNDPPTSLGGGIAVLDNFAYVANGNGGLRIYDVSDPSNPHGVALIGGFTQDVIVKGKHAYLASGSAGLRIFDVSDPTKPKFVSIVDDGGFAHNALSLAVSGQFAFLANGVDGLRAYDVSDPSKPRSAGHRDDGGSYADGVAVSGNRAYLANFSEGLRIYAVIPRPTIIQAGREGVLVSWTVMPGVDFMLQQTAGLAEANWSDMTNTPIVVNNRYQIQIPSTGDKSFFRLRLH